MLNGNLIYYFNNNTKKKVHKLQSILKKQTFSKSKKFKIKAHNGEQSKQKNSKSLGGKRSKRAQKEP
jgi:hypothetical protein